MILVITRDPKQPIRTVRCLGVKGTMASVQIDARVQELVVAAGMKSHVLEAQMARAVADFETHNAAET